MEPQRRTNRTKAVIFINFYALLVFAYVACTKHAVMNKGVHTLDACLLRAFVLIIGAFLLTRANGVSYHIEKKDRCTVFAFTLAGTIGFAFVLFGASLVPLLVQCTLFNTAPFWASILGCVFLRERLVRLEIVALILSFCGVLCVAFSKMDRGGTEDAEESETTSTGTFLLGCVFVLCCAWCEASVTLLSRSLQDVNFSVLLFWYGVVAVPANLLIVLCEAYVNSHSFRLLEYDAGQYMWMLLIAFFNFIGVCSQTIAAQNERSGFVTLLGYIGLVYAFMGDLLIFSEVPNALEVIGVGVILILNVVVVCRKWESPTEEKQSLKLTSSSPKHSEEVV